MVTSYAPAPIPVVTNYAPVQIVTNYAPLPWYRCRRDVVRPGALGQHSAYRDSIRPGYVMTPTPIVTSYAPVPLATYAAPVVTTDRSRRRRYRL